VLGEVLEVVEPQRIVFTCCTERLNNILAESIPRHRQVDKASE
jgi:hypothetical protein